MHHVARSKDQHTRSGGRTNTPSTQAPKRHTKYRGLTITNWCFIFIFATSNLRRWIIGLFVIVYRLPPTTMTLIFLLLFLWTAKPRQQWRDAPAHMRCRRHKRAPRHACAQTTRPACSTQHAACKMEVSNYNPILWIASSQDKVPLEVQYWADVFYHRQSL